MKILRVRRGFTTNSSSYTEWLPPPSGGSGQGATPPPASTSGSTPAQPTSVTSPVAAPAPVQTATTTPPVQQTNTTQGSNLAGNTTTVLGIIATLAAVFIGERLFRRFRRKDKAQDLEDDE